MQLKIEKKNKKVKKKDRAQANKPASAQANLSREPLILWEIISTLRPMVLGSSLIYSHAIMITISSRKASAIKLDQKRKRKV